VIYTLSNEFPVKTLCKYMGINRSSFYKWRNRIKEPSNRMITRVSNINLFKQYHKKYPNHGYRWLNAKIRLDLGLILSNQYAHRVCKYAGIVSISKHYKYKKPGDDSKIYANLLSTDINIDGPYQCVVSDMTAFWCQSTYYELTIYMDIWNNEIISYGLSKRRGDRNSYFEGLNQLLEIKKEYQDLKMILHTDQGSVYSSKSFNELLPSYYIIRSMSRAGTPTDNGAMESINGWVKEEIFNDFNIKESDDPVQTVREYIKYFNNERPAYALNYLTPKQYKEMFFLEQKYYTN